MMGPDYTHWHGTYEIAQHFYIKFIPELEHLIEKGERSDDAAKKEAAQKLQALLDETLESENHRWVIGKMDVEEKAAREKAAQEFKNRYK